MQYIRDIITKCYINWLSA